MKVGLVGYGGMMRNVHYNQAEDRGHEIVAVVDPALEESSALPVCSLDEAIARADGLVVAVPAGHRAKIASKLAASGLPLLYEKPIALRPAVAAKLADCETLVMAENWVWGRPALAGPHMHMSFRFSANMD